MPRSLKEYLQPPEMEIEYHQEHFSIDAADDDWLPEVGRAGWFVIGQDHNYHNNSPELAAIMTYRIGAFYLWGAEAHRWETMRVLARAYERILHAAAVTDRPFVFRVQKSGGLTEVYI